MAHGFENFEERRWLARVWAGGDSRSRIIGTAFAVDDKTLLTCAHVIDDVGAKGPGDRVYVDFPLLGARGAWAVVLEEGWRSAPHGDSPQSEGDTALLRLDDETIQIDVLPLRHRESYKGLDFSSYGFPTGHSESETAHGTLGLSVGLEWVRIEAAATALVEPGFSGAPVWADDLEGVVAMIVTRKQGDGRVAYAIPMDVVARASSIVASAVKDRPDPLAWLDRVPRSFGTDVISFAVTIADRTQDFVGREFVFTGLNRRMEDPEFPAGYIIIRGEPGIGKSAIIARLARTLGYAHHFNIGPENVRSPARFLRNACAQLIVRYELPYDQMPPSTDRDSRTLENMLTEAVNRASERGESRVVLLVDALDEAEDPASGVNRLFLPSRLPAGAYIIATIRNRVDPHLESAQRADDIVLDENSPENKKDITDYILGFIDHHSEVMAPKLKAWGTDRDEFAEILLLQSEGNFMYLHHVLPDIRKGTISKESLDRLDKLPKGLESYYLRHWSLMKDQDATKFRRLQQPILCVLAKAREAVAAEVIVEWINSSGKLSPVTLADVEDVFDQWSQFIHEEPGNPPRYRLYHNSFLNFLEKKVGLERYAQAIAVAMRRKVNWDTG